MTDLRWQSPICGFLQRSSVFCENLRFSAVSCALQMLELPGERVNLRKSADESAKICVLGSLCHLSSVPLSAPKVYVSLPALQKNFVNIFFACLPGNFGLKNGGDFGWIFSGLHLPRNEARKILKKIGENQGRARYGPIPVKTETFRELWAPLVHTNFGGNSYGPIIGPYLFLQKFVWTNGPEGSSKVSPYTGIGPWMALPRKFGAKFGTKIRDKNSKNSGNFRSATFRT